MPWVRIAEEFAQHPKLMKVGPLGMAMQVAALCYCNKNLTDGFIPWAAARTLLSWEFLGPQEEGGRKRYQIAVTSGMKGEDVTSDFVIQLLLEAGIWHEVDGGYIIHDYLDYQPSREQVLAEREAAKKRMANIRRRSEDVQEKFGRTSEEVQEKFGRTSEEVQEKFGRTSEEVQEKFNNPVPVPDPVPDTDTVTDPKENSSSLRSEHASRVGGNGSSLRSEHTEPPEEITNRALIAELVAEYRSIPGIEPKKGDYAFVGRLYNDYGYDEVLTALQELRVSQEFEPKEKPLVWLKAVLQRRAQEQDGAKRQRGKEPPQFQVIRNWLARTGADPPDSS